MKVPENVSPILAPDKSLMLQHLGLLFGRAMEGRVEITAIKAVEHREIRHRFFAVDDLDSAVDWATEINCEHLWNVYVGAALRREEVFPGDPADDGDFLKTYAVWADADNQAEVDSARLAYHGAEILPSFIVVTGRTPERRAQYWWTLETPITEIDVLRSTVRGIADALGTDHGVLTGKQLMRLAGSLAWPKPNKPGRILEHTEMVHPPSAAREVQLERIHRAFPPVERGSGSGEGIADVEVAPAGALGLQEVIMDGREGYAFRLVRAHLREWVGTTGATPTPDELYKEVAPIYLAKVDQVRPGRGPAFLKGKCAEAIRAFETGQIPGMRTLDEAVQSWAEKHRHEPRPEPEGEAGSEDAPDLYEVLSIADLKALPPADWLVKEAIPAQALGFLYGPPGSYKSFVCYDLALAIAYGQGVWLERAIKAAGGILYIASEGATGAQKRITAWQRKHSVEGDNGDFHLIRKTMSFMAAGDVDRLERTVAAHVAEHGPLSLIFVDTVSRVLPGADENLQKDMTIFVAACDRLREAFGATVVGVHHTNKNGDMRGSTVFLGQGDFVFRVDKDDDRKGGVLTCEKQKDAEDGWKIAFDVEPAEWIPEGHIEAVSSLTVAWTGTPDKAPKASQWPGRETLRSMQRDIAAAFMKGKPMAMAPQAKRDGRHAPSKLAATYSISAKLAEEVLETWLQNDVIEVQTCSAHSKIRGLQVLKWLD